MLKKSPHKSSKLKIYKSAARVRAGFPSPAEDFYEKPLSLDELLIKHPASTFFVEASGDSMEGAGIASGDILIVDRSLRPAHGQIVIAVLDQDLTVKEFYSKNSTIKLVARNPKYRDIIIQNETELVIWGVVTSVVKRLAS